MLKTVKNGSGIRVDPPPCFFKIPTFSRFFSENVPNEKWQYLWIMSSNHNIRTWWCWSSTSESLASHPPFSQCNHHSLSPKSTPGDCIGLSDFIQEKTKACLLSWVMRHWGSSSLSNPWISDVNSHGWKFCFLKKLVCQAKCCFFHH